MKGTITALITPFLNEELNEEGLRANIRYQIEQGVDGILALGTTGEAATLSEQERERVIEIAVEESTIPVWVGTGSYSTQETIKKTKRAQESGADVALIVTPYYNKPSQEGIFRHFEAIAHSVEIPIVVYNIPGRCGINLETATLVRIAQLPNVVGVKEASGNVNQAGDVIHALPSFKVFSGDDSLTLPLMALGAVGVVSVVSNLVPGPIVAQVNAALKGDFSEARRLHHELLPLYKGAFIESNPVPIKTAMTLSGMAAGPCRLPLYPLSPANFETLRQLLHTSLPCVIT